MSDRTKKRFIAGAVCPQCGALDRIVVYQKQETDYRECVACGFKSQMRLRSSPGEPATRVTPVQEEPIRLVDPKKR